MYYFHSSTQYSLILNGNPLESFKAKCGVRQGDPISLLLFVIGMEYLSRILKVAGDAEDFNFHPRCSKLKLNHLIFADDLMLFAKRICNPSRFSPKEWKPYPQVLDSKPITTNQVFTLLEFDDSFRSFSTNIFDFTFETLPVKYLGMPLTSKRYTAADYDYLVEK